MRVNYQIIFSIEVLNTYYSHGQWKDVLFIPLPETKKLISDHGYQIRQVKNQLLVITPVDLVSGKPLKLPDFFSAFSFILQPQSPGYINFTNITVSPSGLKCFHFHNKHNNQVVGVNHLTSKIGPYKNTTSYMPGDFATGADGKAYEAIRINTGLQAPDDSVVASKNFWTLRGDHQFVSAADTSGNEDGVSYALDVVGALFNFQTSASQTSHTVTIYAYNFITGKFDKQVFHNTITSDQPVNLVQVDMRTLSSGEYKVKVNDDIRFVYRTTSAADGIPMFIEILHLPKTETNSFLKPDDTLKNIKYTLQFSGRRVFWRYKTRTSSIDKILDSTGEVTFKADGPRFFISEKPIPFSDAPKKTLSANTGTLVITSPLPNPRTDRLGGKRDEIFTTESFINY